MEHTRGVATAIGSACVPRCDRKVVALAMRTTVDIPDALYRELQARAVAEGRSVQALLLDAAAKVVAAGAVRGSRHVQVPLIASKRPGSLKLDSTRIYDFIGFP